MIAPEQFPQSFPEPSTVCRPTTVTCCAERMPRGVPVAIELAFRHGGRLENVEPVAAVTDAYLLPTGMGC